MQRRTQSILYAVHPQVKSAPCFSMLPTLPGMPTAMQLPNVAGTSPSCAKWYVYPSGGLQTQDEGPIQRARAYPLCSLAAQGGRKTDRAAALARAERMGPADHCATVEGPGRHSAFAGYTASQTFHGAGLLLCGRGYNPLAAGCHRVGQSFECGRCEGLSPS